MLNARFKILATSIMLAFGSTAAVAQQTQVGPFLPEVSQAISVVEQGVQNVCAPRGGVASFRIIRIIQNAGYYAAVYEYACVN